VRRLTTLDNVEATRATASFRKEKATLRGASGGAAPELVVLWRWVFWLSGPLIALVITSQWFSPGRLLAGGDNFPPVLIDPGMWMQRMRYAWDLAGLGGPNSLIQVLPQIVFNYLLRLVFAPAEAQHVFYAFLYAAQFLSMVVFVLTILPGHRVAAYLAALFYCFNPFVVLVPPGYLGLFQLAYLPYMAALFIRAATRPLNMRFLAVFAVSAGVSGVLFVNPPLFALFLLFAGLMICYVISHQWRRDSRVLLRVALLAGLFILANVYWIAQAYFVLFGSGHQQVAVTQAQDWSFVVRRSSILNMFWLNPTWAWDYYYPYAPVYKTPILELTVFLPALLAFSSLLNRSIPRRIVLPATSVALVLLLVSTGLHGPWQVINLFLYQHLPLFWLFREPDNKFPILILVFYAPLIGYQAEWLSEQVLRVSMLRPRPRGRLVARACLLSVLGVAFVVTAFPLVTGAVVGRSFASSTKTGVALPGYWYKLKDYLSQRDVHGGVLLLPNDDFYQMPYSWGYYGADVVAGEFLPNRIFTLIVGNGYLSSISSSTDLNAGIMRALKSSNHATILPYLAVQGIKYIVQRNDIVADQPGRHILPPQQVRSYLKAQPYLHFVRSFDQLDLYAVDRRSYVPPIYGVAMPQLDVSRTRERKVLDHHLTTALGFSSAISSNAQSPQTPQVTRLQWTQVNPVRLTVHVNSTTRPLLIVLSTIYNPNWHACIVPAETSIQPWTCWFNGFIPARDHLTALGLFNSWYIAHPGRYTVIIDLGTQHITDFAAFLSLVTVGGIVLAALVLLCLKGKGAALRPNRPMRRKQITR